MYAGDESPPLLLKIKIYFSVAEALVKAACYLKDSIKLEQKAE
jgi:hypothetical protein